MREISLYVAEHAGREILSTLEPYPTVVALSAVRTVAPPDHMHLTVVVPEATFSEILAVVRGISGPAGGTLVSRRLEAVEGAAVRALSPRLGASEAEAVAWEEVSQQLDREATPGPVFLLFVVLASVIAVSGLIVGSIPILIGAMVIPPALGSLIAVCVGTLRGEWRLVGKGLVATFLTLLASIGSAWAVAFMLYALSAIPSDGSLLSADIVQERTQVGLYAYVVALAAGMAGGLSALTNRPSQLVGVMIAAALIPSAATVGLGMARQDPGIVLGALRLLGSNLALILLGGFLAALGLRLQDLWRYLWLGPPRLRGDQGPGWRFRQGK